MGCIPVTLSDNYRRNYRYRSYYLLCNRISNSVVILHYQCSSDDVCHPDIGSEIQYKNDLCYFYADFSALVIPVGGEQLCRSTGYDAGRQAAIAWYRTGLHGLYYRCSHVWCRPRYHFQLQWKYGWNRYYRGYRQ